MVASGVVIILALLSHMRQGYTNDFLLWTDRHVLSIDVCLCLLEQAKGLMLVPASFVMHTCACDACFASCCQASAWQGVVMTVLDGTYSAFLVPINIAFSTDLNHWSWITIVDIVAGKLQSFCVLPCLTPPMHVVIAWCSCSIPPSCPLALIPALQVCLHAVNAAWLEAYTSSYASVLQLLPLQCLLTMHMSPWLSVGLAAMLAQRAVLVSTLG